MLLNLIINAEQAMLGRERTRHAGRPIVARGRPRAGVLEINDDGPGVAEDVQGKIFDPFFTTKEVGKGTGLGLTVAYAIVQEHAGRIRVESADEPRRVVLCGVAGDGRRRRDQAPSADCSRTRRARRDTRPRRRGRSRRWRPPCRDALADAGFVVDRAGDGEEALAGCASAPTIWWCAT